MVTEDVSSVAVLLISGSEAVDDAGDDPRSLDDPSELCAMLVVGVEDGTLSVEVAISVESCRRRCTSLPNTPSAQQSATASRIKIYWTRMAIAQRLTSSSEFQWP